jgi:putative salt-induced outer membrane protein
MQSRSAVSIVLSLGFVVAAASASAQQPTGLSGKVAFGYLATSGNSDNNNMNLAFAGAYDAAPWHHSLNGLAVKASSNSVDTAEAYALAWKSRYNITDTNYVFGLAAWDKDKFSGYDQQIREVVGVGRRFIDRERHVLNAEVGLGARQADLRDGTSQDDSILRLAADYHWAISETAEFIQLFAIEQGSDNTYMESVSSLSADILKNTALVLSYKIKNNSDVPFGTEKRDTFTAISLEYSF